MPNLFQSSSSGSFNLKTYFQGPIKEQFNNDVPIFRGADKGKFSWSGSQVNRPLRVRRNQGIGATSDGGNLPAIGRQSGVQAVIAAKYLYARLGITGPMIKHSQNDKGSFVRQYAFELEKAYADVKVDANRQCAWDGTSDLARVNTAAVASTSIVIKGREDNDPAANFIDVGMAIDIYNGSTVVASGVTINSMSGVTPNGTTATLVLDTAVSVSANDVIVRSGSFGNEVQGLLTQLDGGTSTVYSLVRADYVQLQGNVVDLNGGQMTLDSLQQLENECMRRGGIKISAIYSNYDSQRMYQKLLTVDKRYSNTVKGDGGFASKGESYLEWNGKPWVADQACPRRVFMLPEEGIEKYVLSELEVADETGSQFIAQTGVDAFEVRLRMFFNLFNAHAAGSGVLDDFVSP